MSLGKRLFIGEAAAAAPVGSDTLDVFGDGNCLALYTLDYDASDAGGNHDGAPNDLTFGVDGQINWGASFNGSSSYVEISTSNTGLTLYDRTNYSISLWFYTSDVTASSRVFSQEDPSGSVIAIRTDDFYIDTRDEGGSPVATSFNSSSNAWNHAVLTYDGTTYKLYLNGNQTPDATYTHSLYPKHATASGVVMALGARRTGGTSAGSFNGKLDQVRIFDRAISPTEVSTLYGETATVYTPTTDTLNYQDTITAYYKFDGNANDETTNYDGTESNITYEFGRFGTAAVFNGTSSYVSLTDIPSSVSADISISAWINADTLSGDRTIVSLRENRLIEISINSGYSAGQRLEFKFYDGVSNKVINLNENLITVGNWHHVCLTAQAGGNMIAYFDGVAQGSPLAIGNVYPAGQGDTIGAYISGSGGFFDGKIDQVRIYGLLLDATEVANLYNEKQAYITKNASDPFGDNSEVAFYELENNANDSTGSNTGAASNVTFTSGSGLFGTYAAYFNGSTSNIQVDTLPSITNYNFTFSFWLKTTDTVGYAIDFRDPIYITIGTGLFAGGASGMGIYDGTNSYSIENTAMQTINDGNWYHIVMTHDGTSLKGYLDGNIIGTVSTGTTTQSPGGTNHNRIGQRGDGSTSYAFKGDIDQVRIFNRALDGDEVFNLYAEVIN
jgi:hypothetical protein